MARIFLLIATIICINLSNAQNINNESINQSNQQLFIQLIDSKISNLDNKINLIEQSNKDSIDSIKSSTDNKLDSEFKQLDTRDNYVGWWINLLGIWITLLSIAATVFGFIVHNKINEIEILKNEAETLLTKIRKNERKSQKITSDMAANRAIIASDDMNTYMPLDKNINEPNNNKTVDKYIEAYNKAIKYQSNGELNNAIAEYRKVIESSDNKLNTAAHNNRGNCYLEQKEYSKALDDFTKAIELNNNDAMLYLNRGNCFRELAQNHKLNFDETKQQQQYDDALSNYNKAIDDFKKAINLDNNYVDAYVGLGGVCNTTRQFETAIQLFNKALEISPNDPYALYNMAISYIDEYNPNKDISKALDCLEKALRFGLKIPEKILTAHWSIHQNNSKFKELLELYYKE